jgi:hypothetical protein
MYFKQDIQLVSKSQLLLISGSYNRAISKDINSDMIGVFNHKGTSAHIDYSIFETGTHSEGFQEKLDFAKANLKEGQFIYRIQTEKMKLWSYKPLIKIDMNKEMVYFLKESDEDEVAFERKGCKIRYMKSLFESFGF